MSDNPLKKKSEGLGDTVEKVAFIATLGHLGGRLSPAKQKNKKKDCGCAKRKAALNKAAGYKKTEEGD